MKDFKIVTQKKGKYRQKILTWQFKGKQQRQTIPKALWYLIDEIESLDEFLSALADYQAEKSLTSPKERLRRFKGEGSGLIRKKICEQKNKDGTTRRYTQHWFQYELDGKQSSKYIPIAMVDTIMDLNARKVPVFIILKRLR